MSQFFFCLQTRVKWLWFVCHEPCYFLLFTSAEGKGSPLPFWGPSQSFGFSLFPLPVSGDLRSLSTNICLSPLWPTFFLNGHFFDGLILSIQIRGVVLVLPLRLRGLWRDNVNKYFDITRYLRKISFMLFKRFFYKHILLQCQHTHRKFVDW